MSETLTRPELAVSYFKEGYNCSQSVVLAFADLVPLDRDTLLKLASPFGGGMGRLREVCGSVSGMFTILGLLYGYSSPETGEKKKELYTRVQELAHSFEEKNGSIVCRELLGLGAGPSSPEPTPRTADFYKKRPCAEYIRCSAEILDEYIKNNPPKKAD